MSTNTYPVFFDSAALSTSSLIMYTVPRLPSTITLQDLQLKVTNYTNATRQVTMYAVPDGEPERDELAIAPAMSVPPHDYIIVPVPRLRSGGSIRGFADMDSSLSVQPIGGKLHTP